MNKPTDPHVFSVIEALAEAGVQAAPRERSSIDPRVDPAALASVSVYMMGETPVVAVVAGDKTCKPEAIPRAVDMEGEPMEANLSTTITYTGFPPGGVSPFGLPPEARVLIDPSLKRFGAVFVPAGRRDIVVAVMVKDLTRISGGIVSYAIADPPWNPLA